MLSSCFIIIASMCIHQTATANIFRQGDYISATVEIHGVRIESQIESDNIIIADLEKLHNYCNNEVCFYYTMNCHNENSQRNCEFYYSFTRDRRLRKISFFGNASDLEYVLANVGFIPGRIQEISFAMLTYDNGLSYPPACSPRSGCNAHGLLP